MRTLPLLSLVVGLALCGCGHGAPAARRVLGPANASATQAAVTFRVTVPSATPAGDVVYVAGDFQGWNPGSAAHAFTKQPDGRWTLTLDLAAGTPIQFKFTRGSWANVEKGASGEEIANRTLTPAAGATYDFTVQRWADLGSLTGNVTTFTYAPFLSGRRVWVYLPPGYDASSQRYPVLYMHDGQNLFDVRTSFAGEWQVDETCEQLIGAGEIAPLIVVGIDNGPARIAEYTPWADAGYAGSGQAETYLQAVIAVLKPEIDRRYRTLTSSNYTWMAGSSLGGLVSTYAGLAHGDVFGRVAALSPSYWWDNAHMVAYATGRPRGTLRRVYHDMGTNETGNASSPSNATYIAELRAVRDALVADGFTSGFDLQTVEASGHVHNETYWAMRLPNALRFLVGSPVTAGVP
jgi:predicted alpha/beta superfamily hydrolase